LSKLILLLFVSLFVTGCSVFSHVPSSSPNLHLTEAVELLGDADDGWESAADLNAVMSHVEALRTAGDERSRARADYLAARVAAAGGSYQRAVAFGERALPRLESELKSQLVVLIAHWRVLSYAQYGTVLGTDSEATPASVLDMRIAADNLREGPEALKKRLSALRGRSATLSLFLSLDAAAGTWLPQERLQLDELRRGICQQQGQEEEACPDFEYLSGQLWAWYGRNAEGLVASERAAMNFARQPRLHSLAALAWIQAGDVSATTRSTPLELNLQPSNNQTVVLHGERKPLPEFVPVSEASLAQAQQRYAKAAAVASNNSAIRGQLLARTAYLAWERQDYAQAARLYGESRDVLSGALYSRAAFRAAIAALVAAHAGHVELSGHTAAFEHMLAEGLDYGLVFGAAKLLDRAAMFLDWVRADPAAAYGMRTYALRLLRNIPAQIKLIEVLDNQERLLTDIGELRHAVIFSEEKAQLMSEPISDVYPIDNLVVALSAAFNATVGMFSTCFQLDDTACARRAENLLDKLEVQVEQARARVSKQLGSFKRLLVTIQSNAAEKQYRSAGRDYSSDLVEFSLPIQRIANMMSSRIEEGKRRTRDGRAIDAQDKAEIVEQLALLKQAFLPMHRGHQAMLNITERAYNRVLEDASSSANYKAMAHYWLGEDAEAGKVYESAANRWLAGVTNFRKQSAEAPANDQVLHALRIELDNALTVLLNTHNAAQAESLYKSGDAAFPGTFLVSDKNPWERTYIRARLDDEFGKVTRADAEYKQVLHEVNERRRQITALSSESNFDDSSGYVSNDYISFLLRQKRPIEGVSQLEQFRAKESQLALLATAALQESGTRELAEYRAAKARLQALLTLPSRGQNGASKASSSVDRAKKDFVAARHKVLVALGGSSAEGRTFDDLLARVTKRVAQTGHTLLVYHLNRDYGAVTVLSPGKSPILRLLPADVRNIRDQVDTLVSALQSNAADDEWNRSAEKLYDQLIAPVADLLPPSADGQPVSLGIVPFGKLHELPFSVLMHQGHPLISTYDIFYEPSLLAYAAETRTRQQMQLTPLQALGFNGETLTHAESEAQHIAKDEKNLSVGPRATRNDIFRLLAEPGTLHIAAHAEIDPIHPLSSWLRLADGDLHLLNVPGHEIHKSLIVLSACQTGISDAHRSDQRTDFATTFLEHGVGSVMVSGWQIDDSVTEHLMSDFYAQLEVTQDPVRALGSAQRNALATRGTNASASKLRHPGSWAPFWLIGNPHGQK